MLSAHEADLKARSQHPVELRSAEWSDFSHVAGLPSDVSGTNAIILCIINLFLMCIFSKHIQIKKTSGEIF